MDLIPVLPRSQRVRVRWDRPDNTVYRGEDRAGGVYIGLERGTMKQAEIDKGFDTIAGGARPTVNADTDAAAAPKTERAWPPRAAVEHQLAKIKSMVSAHDEISRRNVCVLQDVTALMRFLPEAFFDHYQGLAIIERIIANGSA